MSRSTAFSMEHPFMARPAETAQRLRNSFRSAMNQWFVTAPIHAGPQLHLDERDCMTQGEIPDIFVVLPRDNGSTAKVDAGSLIDYILSTGDYTDPETRQPLAEETLMMLDVFGKRLGKPSIIKARDDRAAEYHAQHETREALTSLENIVGACVSDIYDAVEAVNERRESPEDASVRLLTNVIPILQDAFAQMTLIDLESARICASQQEAFLLGPRRRPTPDRYGFLNTALNLFHTACGQD